MGYLEGALMRSLAAVRGNEGVSLLLVGQTAAAETRDWAGSEVTTAEPTEALRALYATRPDLILFDCPEDASTEIEAIGRVRRFSAVPIIAAVGAEDAGVHALHAGADSIAPKPISWQELLPRIRKLLDRGARLEEVLGDRVVPLDQAV
jgi:DNA-binding response OmpR family regulator